MLGDWLLAPFVQATSVENPSPTDLSHGLVASTEQVSHDSALFESFSSASLLFVLFLVMSIIGQVVEHRGCWMHTIGIPTSIDQRSSLHQPMYVHLQQDPIALLPLTVLNGSSFSSPSAHLAPSFNSFSFISFIRSSTSFSWGWQKHMSQQRSKS